MLCLAGMDVLGDGNTAVIDALEEAGALIRVEDYEHKYPYDWRTKKPTIFRATSQVGAPHQAGTTSQGGNPSTRFNFLSG